MGRLASRLQALVRQAGLCPRHEMRPVCSPCESPEPLPEPLSTGVGDFIEAIFARVGSEGIKAILLRVPRPPVQRPCGRCGGPRQCPSCQEEYMKAVLDEIELTAEEQAMLDALLAECRARERGRG
jgi:hypothetical protein